MTAFGAFSRAAFALAVPLAAAAALPSAAAGSTPSPVWAGSEKLHVYCIMSGLAPRREALQRRLCERLTSLAARGAPLPVDSIAPGDPELMSPRSTSLLAHFSVEAKAGRTLVAFTLRPFRVGTEAGEVLFGTPPRALVLEEGEDALDASLTAALAETLPWHLEELAARPLP